MNYFTVCIRHYRHELGVQNEIEIDSSNHNMHDTKQSNTHEC